MKLLTTQHTYYLLAAISLILLLNFKGCKDLEDCRSIYTNTASIAFKGEGILVVDTLEYDKPNKYGPYIKDATGNEKLKNLKDESLPIHLDPKYTLVTLLFHRATSAKPDTITIFYQRIPSMLSPNCGLQEEYIIKRVETTFTGSKVIKPALRSEAYESSNPEEENKPGNEENKPDDGNKPGNEGKPGDTNKPETNNNNGGKLPNTGAVVTPIATGALGLAMTALGFVLNKKRNKK